MNLCVIVESPDRNNIKISVKKVKNNSEVEDSFDFIFSGLKNKGKDFPKLLIFCNTKNVPLFTVPWFKNLDRELH